MNYISTDKSDLEHIHNRVQEKLTDYILYNFSQTQNNILKMFFDLAQEFESMPDLYRICVVVPQVFMQIDCDLYLLDQKEKHLELVCNTRDGIVREKTTVPAGIYLSDEPYESADRYVVPIFRKSPGTSPAKDFALPQHKSFIMGMFVVSPLEKISEDDRFFILKYANRIGFRLHNRQIARQNISHLKFINTLVMDIEHNVIIPNMYFRHLFNQMRKKIQTMNEIEGMMQKLSKEFSGEKDKCNEILKGFTKLRKDFLAYNQEMKKHHANISLFLESLFRREHFEYGHLVLRPKRCLIEEKIIKPQLEHYISRMKVRGIRVEQPDDMVGQEIPIVVDVGLLAQVYANLFSNAVKYTEEVIDHQGKPRKSVIYGREVFFDYFGPGQNGIKFNVFTTGPHLNEIEAEQVFTEGGRAKNSQNHEGSGHGLAFIKHVIEMHGGQVGYEPTAEGNNFYFILPVPITTPLEVLPDTDIDDIEKERRRGINDRRRRRSPQDRRRKKR